MTCIHAYDISTGLCAKCGCKFIDAAYPSDGKSVTWDEIKTMRKREATNISEQRVERYAQAIDRLSPESKARLLNLVRYLTLHQGRWGRVFNSSSRDETLDSLLGEVNDLLWNESEIGFEIYT